MWWYGTMGIGWIFWILIVAVIVLLLVCLLKTQRPIEGSRENRALDILKERFAKGEIDQEEYEQKRKVLLR